MRVIEPRVRWLLVAVAGLSIGFSSVVAWRSHQLRSSAGAEPDPRYVYKVELRDSPLRGSAEAPVTIVQFSSYGCAKCLAVEEAVRKVAAVASGGVRVVVKDLPQSQSARVGARAARVAAARGKFWEFHDRLMSTDAAAPALEAVRLGWNEKDFRVEMEDPALEAAIDADVAQARRFGLTNAPAVFVNGKFVKEPTYENLRAQVDEASDFADQLIAGGTPGNRVYAALMRGALPSAAPIRGLGDFREE